MATRNMTVGETNGRISMLFRINQVLLPVLLTAILAICVWVFSRLWEENTRITTVEVEIKNIDNNINDLKKSMDRLSNKIDSHLLSDHKKQ